MVLYQLAIYITYILCYNIILYFYIQEMNAENIDEVIIRLHNDHNWKDIVNLSSVIDSSKTYRLFWVLPTLDDLSWMTEIIKEYKILGIISIGCGCGLIEWLLQNFSGLNITGLELDNSWWRSKYAPPLFLENIIFINENKGKNFLVPKDHAVLFCYFNNGEAFCNYIANYEGNIIFVIGPAEDQERITDPLPFDEKFVKFNWKLLTKRPIMNFKDYIVVYTR
ncbi:PREDICTED: uncharacterized protein LOC106783714 [Polistes canadensis]|uniref:uncharacterized protein LOC106783714 n=1 Tax=Polistes canadensis TaxID=91411 RepID=UPI000718D64C|nr:PREDICTED: uncharacterized protein LOC106783714 [Polistes canadensis]